jgi:hypothetical protein
MACILFLFSDSHVVFQENGHVSLLSWSSFHYWFSQQRLHTSWRKISSDVCHIIILSLVYLHLLFPMRFTLLPWTWGQQFAPKRWYLSRLHGVAFQTVVIFIITAVRTSTLTSLVQFLVGSILISILYVARFNSLWCLSKNHSFQALCIDSILVAPIDFLPAF